MATSEKSTQRDYPTLTYSVPDFLVKVSLLPEEALNITAGSETDKGLQFYKDFVSVYTLMGTREGLDLLNIPEESEKAFDKITS